MINTNDWTDEMETAKWNMIRKYFWATEISSEDLRMRIGAVIFERQLAIGNLEFHKAKPTPYWQCKDVNKY